MDFLLMASSVADDLLGNPPRLGEEQKLLDPAAGSSPIRFAWPTVFDRGRADWKDVRSGHKAVRLLPALVGCR